MKRTTLWKVGCLIISLVALPVSNARAEYISESGQKSQNDADKNTRFIAALDAVRGKTFWYQPNPGAGYNRIKFIEPNNSGDVPADPWKQENFLVTTETSFTIVDYTRDKKYLKLEFSDGKIGYIAVFILAHVDPDKYPVIENLYTDESERIYDFLEYIFSRPPKEIFDAKKKTLAAQKEKQQKAASAWKARGGVHIGMTSAQVLKSNWGKPSNINRTTTLNGSQEQWVYGSSNSYLYFENGILTSIQN